MKISLILEHHIKILLFQQLSQSKMIFLYLNAYTITCTMENYSIDFQVLVLPLH